MVTMMMMTMVMKLVKKRDEGAIALAINNAQSGASTK